MTVRERTCHQPLHGGKSCTGESEESKDCNTHECPGNECNCIYHMTSLLFSGYRRVIQIV